jgi:hypothetical protein
MSGAGLRPYSVARIKAILVWLRDSRPDADGCARSRRKARNMRHIAGTALAVGCVALVGAALLAGLDDIRRFQRMRSM